MGARQLASWRSHWAEEGGGKEEELVVEEEKEEEIEKEELEELDGVGSDGEDVDEAGDAGLARSRPKLLPRFKPLRTRTLRLQTRNCAGFCFAKSMNQLAKPNATRNAIFSGKSGGDGPFPGECTRDAPHYSEHDELLRGPALHLLQPHCQDLGRYATRRR